MRSPGTQVRGFALSGDVQHPGQCDVRHEPCAADLDRGDLSCRDIRVGGGETKFKICAVSLTE